MAFEDKKQATRIRRKKTCWFTENNIKFIDYKDEKTLRRFISERGKIIAAFLAPPPSISVC